MAGISDAVFRRICVEHGCDFTYTEMVSAKGLFYGGRKTRALIRVSEAEKPCAVQLFGSDPGIISEMIKALADEYAGEIAMIDINMGCPMPKITGNGEGSALMRDIPRAAAVAEAAVKASPLPVSCKFRKGWDDNSVNAVEFARAMEESGVSLLTVHGRTREQLYHGPADWDIIGEVVSRVGVPVLGNGDVFSGEAAKKLISHTGCAGVMVARGAEGNPFIFEEIRAALDGRPYSPPTEYERMTEAIRHTEEFLEEKGPRLFPEMRKHLSWYTKGMRGSLDFRRAVNTVRSPEEMLELLRSFRDQLVCGEAGEKTL
ncbi:MAG: tRNA dihydrouridine synthase DusB [Clostridia bacterium]|nr:tRNA dihydrouridine synthase DusB [Clostridia bacterium]